MSRTHCIDEIIRLKWKRIKKVTWIVLCAYELMHRFSVELSVTTLFIRTMRRCACTQFEIFRIFFFVCYRWVLVRAFWQILPISSMMHNQLHINGRWTEKKPILIFMNSYLRTLWLEHADYWLEHAGCLAWVRRGRSASFANKKEYKITAFESFNWNNRGSKLLHLQKNVVGFCKNT